ncbi:MAG: TlpA disulfide reductase family protein, partial [bacterium]
LEAGNINITIDEEFEMKMSGSPINDMINSSEAITEAYYEAVDSIKELAITRGEKLNLMNAAQKVRNDKLIEEITPFINTDPALIFMNAYYNLFTIEEITHLRSLLTTESLEKRTPTMERGEKKPIGTYVTDTKIPNLEGDSISLMSVIESYEYTLIDFWASWCGPCIRSIPEVKEIYSKYKSEDFEIIAVSLDREYSEWKNAVERYNFEWVNLSNLQAWKSPCVQEYSILYIPLKVLVDREGKVISRNPTAEELDIYLSK